jgi:hypothetical protein
MIEIAGLRDDYVAGNLDFDPLGFGPDEEDGFIEMRTKVRVFLDPL